MTGHRPSQRRPTSCAPRPGPAGAVAGSRCAALRVARAARSQRGQASVELLAALPALLALGLVVLQLLAVGYSAVLAGTAAEAGALALAAGGDAASGAREALPGWSRAKARISVSGGTVRVRLRPPSPLAILERKFAVDAAASVRL